MTTSVPDQPPFVRIVGDGVDITINVQDIEDIDISHRAIDLAFERHKKKNAPATMEGPSWAIDQRTIIGDS